MRISSLNVQFQINVGPQIKDRDVYFEFGRVDPAFILGPAFNRENTVCQWRGEVELFRCVLHVTYFLLNLSARNQPLHFINSLERQLGIENKSQA